MITTSPTAGNSLLRQWQGPLTEELLRAPGNFGLGQVPSSKQPDATTTMVCGYCSTGCGLNIHLKNGEAVNLTPTVDYSVNAGMACPKGWEALSVLDCPDRGTMPLLRDDQGRRVPVKWDIAVRAFCDSFKKIQERHGKHSVAFLSTGQIPTEEMAYLGSLAKFGMGMLHGDGNTRQCMATSVVAYKQAFGFDAPPYTYQDFEESDVIVLVGSNLCIAHPIMWQRVCRNPHEPEIIVLDPRTTETAAAATQHLALKPKSDLALLYGLAHILIAEGWINDKFISQHTEGYVDFRRHVESFTPEYVEQVSGISKERLHYAARTIHRGKRVSFWWTMGVNQSYQGVRTAQAIINLALITGNIGRPGTGANSITGQCNAMGSRLFSNTTNLLGGHDYQNAAHRQKVAGVLDIDESHIPTENSWAYDRIIEGILRDEIKGLWVICTNPVHSWINQNTCREILERLDYLVVQDMYHSTETALEADLYIPAAGWGEKEGTFINSERRIGVIKKVAKAPGQALSDFSIFRLVSHYWGCEEMFSRWQQPEDVFQTMKELSRDQPCDITGIEDYRMLDDRGGIQWPYPEGCQDEQSERRLFADGQFYHPDGRAKMLFEDPSEMPEPPNPRYPYLLLTGRGSASQWHTQTRTSKSSVLRGLYPLSPYVEINPQDARNEEIRPDSLVTITSQRGSIQAKAFVTPTIQAGQVFIPMHYETTNQLTHAHFDPYSRQPSYKNCAVRISPAHVPVIG
ncbi:molybdopterin oxidoreductase family protein [Bythopirellula goksoeyrii]|uniref:Nitrate reductase n=1 Tax=Bythopirellula goksoeyrii TaxID=1400387 RepID=A0A5B9QH23_9BACT|nr:nitrate reductase [Bythopirellula goksoeyrii]QEG37229.1 Nitrate reductase [Bythopirellula goksoeyrii]